MKSRRFFGFLTLCLLATLVVLSNLVRADEPPLRVAITPDSLRFAWPLGTGQTEIRELPLHVTDFSALPQRTNTLGSLANKKGVACLLDVEDGKALGFGQSNQNINIGWLIDWQSAEPKLSFEFEGRRIGLRSRRLIATCRRSTRPRCG